MSGNRPGTPWKFLFRKLKKCNNNQKLLVTQLKVVSIRF